MLTGLNHITVAVNDVDRSFNFYVDRLGFKPRARWQSGAYLTLGDLWFCLSLDSASPSRDYTHIAFNVGEDEFDGFVASVMNHDIKLWKQNRSEGKSLYLLDPDGNKLEIHSGDIESRLKSMSKEKYPDLQRFD